jgi:hypothetical protein
MTWDNLLLDDTISPLFDELHARIENYQIYSLAWNDEDVSTVVTNYLPAINQTVSIRTSRSVTLSVLPNNSEIIPNPFNLLSMGYTVRYYSRLVPGNPIPTFQTVDLQYRGEDDPARTIPRILPSQSIVTFNPAGWTLDAEESVPDTTVLQAYRTEIDANIQYGYTTYPSPFNRPASVQVVP